MTKPKKLTLSAIDKANSNLNEFKKIKILREYDVTIHLKFRMSKIRNVIIDYFKLIQDLKNRDDVSDETLMNSLSLLNIFILREFSDVPIPSINDINNLIKVANALLDTGILEEVFTHFPKDQIEIISRELEKSSKNIGEMLGELTLAASFNQTGVENDGYNELEAT